MILIKKGFTGQNIFKGIRNFKNLIIIKLLRYDETEKYRRNLAPNNVYLYKRKEILCPCLNKHCTQFQSRQCNKTIYFVQ